MKWVLISAAGLITGWVLMAVWMHWLRGRFWWQERAKEWRRVEERYAEKCGYPGCSFCDPEEE